MGYVVLFVLLYGLCLQTTKDDNGDKDPVVAFFMAVVFGLFCLMLSMCGGE